MNIVILHCHYERGGVTQVVENHLRALRESSDISRIILVSGDRVGGLSAQTRDAVTQLVIQNFDYDSETLKGTGQTSSEPLLQRAAKIVDDLCKQFAANGLSKQDTVLHWHNHSLGKNVATPAVIAKLAANGWRMLLQIHDFAEDNRPTNYQGLVAATTTANPQELDRYLYPVAKQIHYATLTRADAEVLEELGVGEGRTHCLPNSVVAASEEQPNKEESLAKIRNAFGLPGDAKWSLYPVRGIRRKNVGEFLLLSRWTSEVMFSGLTLCPTTPVEKRSYERWRRIAAEVSPRAVFDAAHDPRISFADNLAASEYAISTSVAEGFGMAFLEPWLCNRGVIARRLPTVTKDFELAGVQLPKLYDAIPITGDPNWVRQRREELIAVTNEAWSEVPDKFRPNIGASLCERDWIDFAMLTPLHQIDVLRKLSSDPGFEEETKARSAELVTWLNREERPELIHSNATVIREHFSPTRTGDQLESLYSMLTSVVGEADIRGPVNAGSAVELINSIRPFSPCRTEVIDE